MKQESLMESKILLLSDAESIREKELIEDYLSIKNVDFEDIGVTNENELYNYDDFAKLIHEKLLSNCNIICIAVTASGNGIQIPANKYENIIAAPIHMLAHLDEVLSMKPSINVFDIYQRIDNTNILKIIDKILNSNIGKD